VSDLTTLANVKAYLGLKGAPIAGITQANPGVVNAVAHGLVTGQQVGLSGVVGMTQVNGNVYTATKVDADHFSIGVDTTAFTAYSSYGFASSDDPLLSRFITAASRWVEQWLSRTILTATYTETRDGNGGAKWFVGDGPIQSVTSVTVGGVLVPATNYVFSGDVITFIKGDTFARGLMNCTVVYVGGYTSVPLDLEESVIEIIALRYRERSRTGEVSKSVGGAETVSYSQKDVPEDVKTNLKQWRKVVPA